MMLIAGYIHNKVAVAVVRWMRSTPDNTMHRSWHNDIEGVGNIF